MDREFPVHVYIHMFGKTIDPCNQMILRWNVPELKQDTLINIDC
jgi:hypothetical protein